MESPWDGYGPTLATPSCGQKSCAYEDLDQAALPSRLLTVQWISWSARVISTVNLRMENYFTFYSILKLCTFCPMRMPLLHCMLSVRIFFYLLMSNYIRYSHSLAHERALRICTTCSVPSSPSPLLQISQHSNAKPQTCNYRSLTKDAM